MIVAMMKRITALRKHETLGVLAVVLLVTGAAGGWFLSTTVMKNAAAAELPLAIARGGETNSLPVERSRASLVGSYVVTGTDPDGKPYASAGVVDILLVPSGALEIDWDNGKVVGVGQFIDNTLVVAYTIKGRSVISVMNVNPDGSLSGKWLRRTDRGSRGTETWRKA